MKSAKYIVSTTKALVSGLTMVFFLGYGMYYLSRLLWPECIVFTLLGLLFCYQFFKNASYVQIDDTNISLRFAWIKLRELPWSDVREMGVIGENVFSRAKKGKRKTGEKFIYFSPVSMNEKSRFRMIVNWPPKDMLYIEYSPEALERTQYIWNGPTKYYNAEDIYPNTED